MYICRLAITLLTIHYRTWYYVICYGTLRKNLAWVGINNKGIPRNYNSVEYFSCPLPSCKIAFVDDVQIGRTFEFFFTFIFQAIVMQIHIWILMVVMMNIVLLNHLMKILTCFEEERMIIMLLNYLTKRRNLTHFCPTSSFCYWLT